MRARGRGMTWWARTAQKSGSRLLPNAAVPVWLSSALRTSAMAPMAPEKNLGARARAGVHFSLFLILRAPALPVPAQQPVILSFAHNTIYSTQTT